MKILGGMLPDYWEGCIPPWICTHGYEKVRNYRKTLFIQSIVENGWGGMHPPHPPPLDPPLHNARPIANKLNLLDNYLTIANNHYFDLIFIV